MSVFSWSAPIFGHFADRWDDEQVARLAALLLPDPTSPGLRQPRILDVGGGTGALARRLHRVSGADVTVLDPTPQMLRYLPADDHVRGVLGTAEKMPFDDDSFDALIVTDAFHHFRDQPGAVREFARVVRQDGRVLVMELDPRGAVMRVIVAAERLLGEPGAFYTPEEMCRFMAAQGIRGECEPLEKASYRYLGTVKD